jgi:hypothetical protein
MSSQQPWAAPAGPGASSQPSRSGLDQRALDALYFWHTHAGSVPRCGVSLAFLRAFLAKHAGRTVPPTALEAADAARFGQPPPCAAPFEALTTAQVKYRLVIPHAEAVDPRAAYAQQMLRADARDARGAPAVGPATVFVSHAWSYTFATLAETVLDHFAAEEAEEVADGAQAASSTERVYLWIGAPPHGAHHTPHAPPPSAPCVRGARPAAGRLTRLLPPPVITLWNRHLRG